MRQSPCDSVAGGPVGPLIAAASAKDRLISGRPPPGDRVNLPSEGSSAVEVIVERCAGLDVHRDNVVATVRVPGSGRRQWDKQTQTFKSTLAGVTQLAEWLAEAGVTLVGMEATGVYWRRCSRRSSNASSAGCSTRTTCATSRVTRPT